MKLMFADMDDTLLSTDKTISKKNLEAVRALTKAGHGFVMCTGRPLYSCKVLAKQYDLMGENYYIASYNGGQIVDTGSMKELVHEGVSYEVVRTLFDEAPKWKLNVQTYNDDCILVEEDSEYIKWYSTRIRMPYKVVDDVMAALEAEPLKCIVAHLTDHAALERFQAKVGPKLSDVTENLFSNPVLLEVGSKRAGMGRALENLCDILGVDRKDTVAVGDEANDIDMIKKAGLGIAMINGTEDTRRAADIITEKDNDHDAIAEIIERYFL